MTTTSAVTDQLHSAAKAARSGASDLYAARSRVGYAVEDARVAGFDVGEDLSVADRLTGGSAARRAARQAQAQSFAGNIRQRAAQLVGLDQQVAGKITAAVAGIRRSFPQNPDLGTPPQGNRVHAVDNHTFKQVPPSPGPPGPPVNPFAGWSDEQMRQVAVEIAHGHAWVGHRRDFPGEWSEPDLARWIYESMNAPDTRFGTDTKSGALTLLRDGRVILVNPNGGDFGTTFVPKPLPGEPWRTPQEYFDRRTGPYEPLPRPTPERLPPLSPGEIAPRLTTPIDPPLAPAPRPVPPSLPPIEAPLAPRPAPPPIGSMGGGGGGGIPGLGHGTLHQPTLETE